MGYIQDLRKVVGTRLLIMCGACVLVINNRQQVLMQLRKDNGCWGLIGGSMELGETLEQVAHRELFEETGLTAKSLQLINTYSGQDFYYQYPHGDVVYIVVSAFECKEYSGLLVHDQNEATMLQFYSLDDLPKNISPPDRPILEDYIGNYRKSPSNH
ncbi:NUDIX domain-containing protein [Lysinibacillus sphaericus]|uniref:NUDIX domain-containing protein n=1 Tax=Lysinibacillus sphaericus TaxID=1421 RepID=A0A544UQ60_LYSSH|nr:NUDIX hydrolase [Lysinibacillus sp. SDF0037]TQR35991.1 NUDIX domain-containing protein [Lysinibacillus sp. SDF0037]